MDATTSDNNHSNPTTTSNVGARISRQTDDNPTDTPQGIADGSCLIDDKSLAGFDSDELECVNDGLTGVLQGNRAGQSIVELAATSGVPVTVDYLNRLSEDLAECIHDTEAWDRAAQALHDAARADTGTPADTTDDQMKADPMPAATQPMSTFKDCSGAALKYASLGLRVVQIKPGTKRPRGDDWQTKATTNPKDIQKWFNLHSDHGVGIATGKTSGVFVLDVDTDPSKNGDESLAELEHEHGQLPDTVTTLTPSGGWHLYYRYPEGEEIRNSASTVLGLGLDIRGNGGQVVAPPTIHPDYGERYEFEHGHGPHEIEIAEAPEWMIKLLTSDEERAPRRQKSPNAGNRPGDLWAADQDWPDLLERSGAVLMSTHNDRRGYYELWSRPPMPGETDFVPHVSASLYYKGCDSLHVFSTNWQVTNPETGETTKLKPEESCDKFAYFTHRFHGGNYTESAKAVVAMGYSRTMPPVETSGPVMNGSDDGSDEVPLLKLFADPFLEEYFEATAESTSMVSRDMCLLMFLFMSAAPCLTHQRLTVEFKEGWDEGAQLAAAVGALSSGGKSVAFGKVTGAMKKLQASRSEAWRALQGAAIAELAIEKDIAKDIQRRASKTENSTERRDLTNELADRNQRIAELEAVVNGEPVLNSTSVTPESVLNDMVKNGGTKSIVLAESGPMRTGFDQYGDGENVEWILNGWSRDEVQVSRASRATTTESMAGALCVAVAPQSGRLALFEADTGHQESGLSERFLSTHPTAPPRRLRRDQGTVPTAMADRFTAIMERLLVNAESDRRYVFSAEATKYLEDWDDSISPMFEEGGPYHRLLEVFREKLFASLIRISLIVHVVDGNGHVDVIDVGTVQRVAKFGEYLLDQKARIRRSAWQDANELAAVHGMRWLLRHFKSEDDLPKGLEFDDEGNAHFELRTFVTSGVLDSLLKDRGRAAVTPVIAAMIDNGWCEFDGDEPPMWQTAGRGKVPLIVKAEVLADDHAPWSKVEES